MNKLLIILILTLGMGFIFIPNYVANKNNEAEIKSIKEALSGLQIQGGEIAAGRTRVRIGNQTLWSTDLVPSASFTVNLGSAALPINDYFGVGASFSENISFAGEIKPDAELCSNNQILKKTGANNWDCATDAIGTFDATAQDALTWSDGANASNLWTFDVSGTNTTLLFGNATLTLLGTFVSDGLTLGANENLTLGAQTLDHDGTTFVFSDDANFDGTTSSSFDGSLIIAKGLTANSYQSGGLSACISDGNVLRFVAGQFSCGTLADADIPNTITINTATVATTLTITDNESSVETNAILFTSAGDLDGGDIGIESDGDLTYTPNTGNISATAFGGITEANLVDKTAAESITGNLWTFGNSSGEGIEVGNTGVRITSDNDGEITFLSISAGSQEDFTINLDDTSNIAVLTTSTGMIRWDWGVIGADYGDSEDFEVPNAAGGTTIDTAGQVTIDTTAGSFNYHDGTAERVLPNYECKTFSTDSLSATDQWGGVKFRDPATIFEVSVVASGTGSVGWSLVHGAAGSVTTTLFTEIKGASTTTYPTYTTFSGDNTLADNEVLDIAISSTSADLAELAVTACWRYDP